MGSLRSLDDGRLQPLCPALRIGREPGNDLTLACPTVSAVHACVRWSADSQWEVQDLGSRNGTWLDGVRLLTGARQALNAGQVLEFGSSRWTVHEITPPAAMAWATRGERICYACAGMLSLDPGGQTVLFVDAHGSWICEREGVAHPVVDRQIIAAGDESWVLHLPRAVCATSKAPLGCCGKEASEALSTATFAFDVSPNGEFVEMQVELGQRRWQSSRAHQQVLLVLARARVRDALASQVSEDDRGWVYTEIVCDELGYEDPGRLNVEIHRARRELAQLGLPGAANVVERRRGTGMLRFGPRSVVVRERHFDDNSTG